ncbi:unnamed protein product [Heligmosomoides polygyrus]|uniref:DUF5658 domain-containing protein n=1 Tax=Heligmosomoides polygyrus TaxID=6339 RepID=A0A183F273_HELPZ|nr:unnamed protein product [Heligmosomoides polygyrus]
MELLSSLPGWSYTLFDRYAWFLFQVLAAMMMVVDATGLALIPWDRLSVLIVLGVTWFFKFFIVVGGSIPYVFQYAEIHHRRNAQGFSLFVCLALCVANILRILFWFGKRFDNALLAQSVVMFMCMIFMLEISVRMNRKHTPKSQQKSVLRECFTVVLKGIIFFTADLLGLLKAT